MEANGFEMKFAVMFYQAIIRAKTLNDLIFLKRTYYLVNDLGV